MTIELRALVEIIGDDPELIEMLYEVGVIDRDADTVSDAEIEAALITRTLVRELDVNPPGVEIILRLRQEVIAHRRQVAELVALIKNR